MMGKKGFTKAQARKAGSKGGKAKVKKGFATLSREEVREISKKAIAKRWEKYRKEKEAKNAK